ncbi:MAG: glycosyltransferase [Cyclobacteriaceae bacterium]
MPESRIKLLYIIPSLDDGGAQRFTIHFLTHLDRSKFEICLLLLNREGELTHLIPSDIEVVKYDIRRTVLSVFTILREVWRRRPQIAFTTLGHLNLVVSLIKFLFPKGTKVVARETNFISLRNKDERYPKLFNMLFRTTYKHLNLVICQSKSMQQDLRGSFGLAERKLQVIYNPVDFEFIKEQIKHVNRNRTKITFLSVGRLSQQKGYDRILRALSLIKGFEFEYLILGQGPKKQEIERLIENYGLQNVKLFGYSTNPYAYMAAVDCLLLGSRYEGLPNVVLESFACGTPVIAFDAPGGMNEIIKPGVNGWTVPDDDIDAFAKSIQSKAYLEVDRTQIRELAIKEFAASKIMKRYEEILENLD